MRVLVAVVGVLAMGLGACTEAEPLVAQTRFPDDEGVVTSVSLDRVELDDERSYAFSQRVESFKTRSHEVTQLLFWDGKYVQVGLDGDTVTWIAGVGTVTRTDEPIVRYSGVFQEVDGASGRAVFEDGTTLAMADGLEPPQANTEVVVVIDPEQRRITEFLG